MVTSPTHHSPIRPLPLAPGGPQHAQLQQVSPSQWAVVEQSIHCNMACLSINYRRMGPLWGGPQALYSGLFLNLIDSRRCHRHRRFPLPSLASIPAQLYIKTASPRSASRLLLLSSLKSILYHTTYNIQTFFHLHPLSLIRSSPT